MMVEMKGTVPGSYSTWLGELLKVTQGNSTWLGVLLKVNSTGSMGLPPLLKVKVRAFGCVLELSGQCLLALIVLWVACTDSCLSISTVSFDCTLRHSYLQMSECSAWIGSCGARSPADCCACYFVDYRPTPQ